PIDSAMGSATPCAERWAPFGAYWQWNSFTSVWITVPIVQLATTPTSPSFSAATVSRARALASTMSWPFLHVAAIARSHVTGSFQLFFTVTLPNPPSQSASAAAQSIPDATGSFAGAAAGSGVSAFSSVGSGAAGSAGCALPHAERNTNTPAVAKAPLFHRFA